MTFSTKSIDFNRFFSLLAFLLCLLGQCLEAREIKGPNDLKDPEMRWFTYSEGEGCIWSFQCSGEPNKKLWCDCDKICKQVIGGVKQGDTSCV